MTLFPLCHSGFPLNRQWEDNSASENCVFSLTNEFIHFLVQKIRTRIISSSYFLHGGVKLSGNCFQISCACAIEFSPYNVLGFIINLLSALISRLS